MKIEKLIYRFTFLLFFTFSFCHQLNASEYRSKIINGSFEEVIKEISLKKEMTFDELMYLGLAYELSDKPSNAISSYQKALEIKKTAWLFGHLVRAYFQSDNLQKAEETALEGLKFFPNSETLKKELRELKHLKEEKFKETYSKVYDFFSNEKYKKAITEANKALKTFRNNRQLLLLKFYANQNSNRLELARQNLMTLNRIYPNDTDVRTATLRFNILTKNTQGVEEVVQKIESSGEKNYQVHYQLALYYIEQNNLDKAEMEARRSIEIEDNHYNVYELLGYILLLQKKYDTAIKSYRKSINLYGDNINAYLALDKAYGAINKEDESKNALLKAIKKEPSNTALRNRLGYKYNMLGEFKKAEEQYRKTLTYDPNNEYAKEALNILASRLRPELTVSYRFSERHNHISYPNSLEDDYTHIDTYTLRGSAPINENWRFTLTFEDVIHDDQRKSFRDEIEKFKIIGNISFTTRNLFINFGYGSSSIRHTFRTDVIQEEDHRAIGNFLSSYSLGDHQLSVSYSESVNIISYSTQLGAELLKTYLAQDQWAINSQWSILFRAILGKSDNVEYDYFTLSPNYKVNSINGLTLRAEYDYAHVVGGSDFEQYMLGAFYEHRLFSWLDANYDLLIGHRSSQDLDTVELRTNFLFKKIGNIQPLLSLEGGEYFSDFVDTYYGAMVSLRTFF